jgi:hypothetical protein
MPSRNPNWKQFSRISKACALVRLRGAIGIATIPIQTLIVAAIFDREKLTRRNLLSVALGFAGIAIVFGPEAYRGEVSSHWLGDGLMLLGGLSAAIYSVFGRPMFGKYGSMFVIVLAVVFGLLTLTLLAAASWPTFSRNGWIAVIFLGTLGDRSTWGSAVQAQGADSGVRPDDHRVASIARGEQTARCDPRRRPSARHGPRARSMMLTTIVMVPLNRPERSTDARATQEQGQ